MWRTFGQDQPEDRREPAMTEEVQRIIEELNRCTREQRKKIFDHLRIEFPIHEIEKKLNAQAEVICEAIHRASDLTLRGVRGVIAEASFEVSVVKNLEGWKNESPTGDHPYDFLLRDKIGPVRIQIKMQRQKAHKPMWAREAYRYLPSNMYVVETQRTRGGKDSTGGDTRPYRFGEFDVLGVSLHPSSNQWDKFLYTVADWLVPDPNDGKLLLKFQPVAQMPTDAWTDDFRTVVEWFRSGRKSRIWSEEK
jgi:hypothetical protein